MIQHFGRFISELFRQLVLNDYFQVLHDRLTNLTLPRDSWNLPYLPLFIYSSLPKHLPVSLALPLYFALPLYLY